MINKHRFEAPPPVPIENWLSPKEVAGSFGLTDNSAYRWISKGTIPENYLRRFGSRQIRLHPGVIKFLENVFAARR